MGLCVLAGTLLGCRGPQLNWHKKAQPNDWKCLFQPEVGPYVYRYLQKKACYGLKGLSSGHYKGTPGRPGMGLLRPGDGPSSKNGPSQNFGRPQGLVGPSYT